MANAEKELLWYAFLNASPYTFTYYTKTCQYTDFKQKTSDFTDFFVLEHACAVEAEGVLQCTPGFKVKKGIYTSSHTYKPTCTPSCSVSLLSHTYFLAC